jgi:hypothetical protein
MVGPFATQQDWETTLGRALAGHRHVVQHYVPLPRHRVDSLDAQGLAQTSDAHVVHSFWHHAGRLAGGFVRASSAPVVNVHQGGGLGVFQFEPPLG